MNNDNNNTKEDININKIIDELKEILSRKNFKTQPCTAKEELIELEKLYNTNTRKILNGKYDKNKIESHAHNEWISIFDVFTLFNGNINEINIINNSN